MTLITKFDPWQSRLCTCPPKLTLNPYTGCDHHCIYCYASSYVPRFDACRPKKNLAQRLKTEVTTLNGETISLSNSSDPYPNLELQTRLTRQCLNILSENNCRLQIVTKSDLVAQDTDILRRTVSMVSMTITTQKSEVARLLEPGAPDPGKRLKAVKSLIQAGIPVSVRIDPIIPFVNDDSSGLVESLSDLGVTHVTASTLKVNHQNWRRIKRAMPETAARLEGLYFLEGKRVGRQFCLSEGLRLKLLTSMKAIVEEYGMTFGVCREGLPELNSAACDGSGLMAQASRCFRTG